MPNNELLEAIRMRAYLLWEEAGRPEGGDLAFWDQARREVEAAWSAEPAREAQG